MAEKQKTIKKEISIAGKGLHSGKDVVLTIKPAPVKHGYKFKRTDIEGHPVIDANVDLVTDTTRGTTIEKDGIHIQTVEHVLAALVGTNIDNALIELNWSETPILDGSSQHYVERIIEVGIEEQNEEKEYFEIKENIRFYDKENDVEMIAMPSDRFRISTMIDYDSTILGTQNATLNDISDFQSEIAPCRTFVFLHELEHLVNNDLIKGGDVNNAIVFVNRKISQTELNRLATLFNRPKMEVKREGILNNLELRFPNEPARHKLLDVIGDLALIGKPIKAHIIANKPGHSSNIKFSKLLKEHITKSFKINTPPAVDFNTPAVYDINKIKKILPHRPPFLLVDKIIEINKEYVIGLKNVTMNESFFTGHFPDEPVMPGVLQIESMAQVGGIFVLNQVPDPENYLTFFLKIDNARFKKKVCPGDTIVSKLELISPLRRGICQMRGVSFVGDNIVMEAELLAQIVKKTDSK